MSTSLHHPSRTLRATLLLLSLLIGPLAMACTPIASLPFAITQPGKYCLTGNLSSGAAQGIQIAISASDVELDLAGHSISCTANQNGVFTSNSVTLNRVRVKGGQIAGCNFAISLGRCSACSVRAMTLHNNAAGIAIGGDGARVEGNTIRNDDANAGRPAIKLDAYSSIVQDNLVSGSLFGLDINGKENLIRGNHFSGCGNAIRFFAPATYQDNLARCAVNFSGSGLAQSVDAGGNH
jgi:hypothetical protein